MLVGYDITNKAGEVARKLFYSRETIMGYWRFAGLKIRSRGGPNNLRKIRKQK